LAEDYASAPIDPSDRAMLDYAVALTRSPGDMEASDVDALRFAGFEDAAILDICQVTAYYNYVNRLADGLGVELEDAWHPEDLTMSRARFDTRKAQRARSRADR
jgi:uncharacterized peroxidase-related enzyme